VPLAETVLPRLLSGTSPEEEKEVDFSLHDLMFSGHECLFVMLLCRRTRPVSVALLSRAAASDCAPS
jgi:hypothetical protein